MWQLKEIEEEQQRQYSPAAGWRQNTRALTTATPQASGRKQRAQHNFIYCAQVYLQQQHPHRKHTTHMPLHTTTTAAPDCTYCDHATSCGVCRPRLAYQAPQLLRQRHTTQVQHTKTCCAANPTRLPVKCGKNAAAVPQRRLCLKLKQEMAAATCPPTAYRSGACPTCPRWSCLQRLLTLIRPLLHATCHMPPALAQA